MTDTLGLADKEVYLTDYDIMDSNGGTIVIVGKADLDAFLLGNQ